MTNAVPSPQEARKTSIGRETGAAGCYMKGIFYGVWWVLPPYDHSFRMISAYSNRIFWVYRSSCLFVASFSVTDHKHFCCDWKLLWIFIRKFYAAAFFFFFYLCYFLFSWPKICLKEWQFSLWDIVQPCSPAAIEVSSKDWSQLLLLSAPSSLLLFSSSSRLLGNHVWYQSLKSSSLTRFSQYFFFQ